MFLETDFAIVSAHATRDDVIDLIESLGEGQNSMAILGTEDEVYIQTNYLADRDVFGVDYRNGEPRQHYAATVPTKEVVTGVFLSYFAGDNRWRTAVEWKRDAHYEALQG